MNPNELSSLRAKELKSQRAVELKRSFTLLELLIVVAILVILGMGSFSVYRNFLKGSELNYLDRQMISDLKRAQARAMAGESGLKWGLHLVNSSTTDYYEVFSTPTTYTDASATVDITTYLQDYFSFVTPVDSSTIIFDKIAGTTSATGTIVISSPDGVTNTIIVTAIGTIY